MPLLTLFHTTDPFDHLSLSCNHRYTDNMHKSHDTFWCLVFSSWREESNECTPWRGSLLCVVWRLASLRGYMMETLLL